MLSRSALLLLAATLGGCAYPDYATGVAPSYPSGYQPVMGGVAADWPAQPGALWGPEDVPSIDVFREPLSPYGRWLESPQWGLVFVPNAPQGWRPYENGQWMDNRFWLSGDPWGWATDHYGRWGFDQAMGWVWVPDTTWGPSWVAWREADDVVGWAPIPPRVSWSVGIGFGSGWGYDSWNSWYGPSWVWVPRTYVYTRGFGGRIYPWNSGGNWWGHTRWQNTPYWGWNKPWDRSWGWREPNHRPNWNNNYSGGYNRGWNGGWNGNRGWNQPRYGQSGSVGDRIGRDMTGQPPRPGWNGGGYGGNWNRGGATGGWNGGGWNGGGWNGGGWNRGPNMGQPGTAPGTPPGTATPAPAPNGGISSGNNGGWNGGRPPGGGWSGGWGGGSRPSLPGGMASPQPRPDGGGGWGGGRGGWNGGGMSPPPAPRMDGGGWRGGGGGGWQGRNGGASAPQPSRGSPHGGEGGHERPQ